METTEESLDLNLPMEFVEGMDLGQEPVGQGVHTKAVSSVSGQGNKLTTPRSLKLKSYTLTFKKSRTFRTYGYAFQNLIKEESILNPTTKVTTDVGDHVILTTPLGIIPNDTVGFYIKRL